MMAPAPLNVLLVGMPGTSDDLGLLDVPTGYEVTDVICGLKAIHDGHVAVHED